MGNRSSVPAFPNAEARQVDEFTPSKSTVDLLEVIGRGTFGIVYRARWQGKLVAVKRASQGADLEEFRREVQALRAVDHENIIRIFGVSTKEPMICIVMELADCGTLGELLLNEGAPEYQLEHVVAWSLQTADGLAYLHSTRPQPTVHRDLKPANLLLFDHCRLVKIGDFGSSTHLRQTATMTSSVGTILWMAPEVAAGERYTEACDVFSYAIILWQLLTRRTPYHLAVLSEVAPLRLLMMISEEARRPTRIHSCPLVLERLLEAGWARQAEERPEMGFVARLWRFIADICAMPERPNKLDWQGGGKRRVQESESESVEACIDLKALKRCDSLVDALSSSSGRRGDFLRDFSEKRQVALVRRRGVDDGELKRMRLRIEAEVEEKDVERLALKLADAGGEWCCVVVGQGGVMAQAVPTGQSFARFQVPASGVEILLFKCSPTIETSTP